MTREHPMAAWFKTKSKLASATAPQSDVSRAIHTMQDDIAGHAPVESVASDPLVAFQPEQAEVSVPFYAAQAIMPSGGEGGGVSTEPSATASPFLMETPSALEAPAPPDLPLGVASPEGETQPAPALVAEPVAPSTPVAAPPATLPVADIVPPVAPLPVEPTPPSLSTPPPSEAPASIPLKTGGEINPTSPQALLKNLFMTYRFWLIGIVSGIVILALLWSGWQWYRGESKTEPTIAEGTIETPPTPAPAPAEPTPAPEEPAYPHYSVDQPNLIAFDTETVTAPAMTTELLQIALSIQKDNLRQPAEFLVRDQKFNPLAFARFAYLLNLGFSSEILAALDEEFSLYFVMDQVRPRLGLVVRIKNMEAFTTALQTGEADLPKVLEPLYLDTTTAPKTGLVFRSGLYRDQPLRFANVDSSLNLSIDYAVRGAAWYIGTSQNTLRALLDRSEGATASPATP